MICPQCSEPIPGDEFTWLVRGKAYCSEKCARASWQPEMIVTRTENQVATRDQAS